MIDDILLAYVEWRKECAVVRQVYERWSGASSSEQSAIAHVAYSAALDREEAAARVYAGLLAAVGERLKTERDARLVARGAACR